MPWLSLSSTSGIAPTIVTAKVDSGNLVAGNYSGNITISSTGAEPQSINVRLDVTEEISSSEQKVYLPVVTR